MEQASRRLRNHFVPYFNDTVDCDVCNGNAIGVPDPFAEGVLVFGSAALLSLVPQEGALHGVMVHDSDAEPDLAAGIDWDSALKAAWARGHTLEDDDPIGYTEDSRAVHRLAPHGQPVWAAQGGHSLSSSRWL